MLNICNMFAEDKCLHFNAKKTKWIAFHKKSITDEMALQYRKTLSDCIKGEKWKIYMITKILNCINGINESNLNEEENLFLLNDMCTL